MPSITITPLTQPTPNTCAHTCLAMVTGASIESLIERFGDRGLCWEDDALVLVEHGIFPVRTTGDKHEFFNPGVYLVSTPSLNLPGKLHMVVVEASPEGYVVHDPNTGREGVAAYASNAVETGDLARCDVTFLHGGMLLGMRAPAAAAAEEA